MKIEHFVSGNDISLGDYKAFIPNEINHEWVWENKELNILLAKANKELGELNAYTSLIPNIDIYIRLHISNEANKSNRIEGTKTNIQEDMMKEEDISPEKRDDWLEVNNYIKALNHGINRIIIDDFPFTTRLLKELHAILLSGARGKYKTPGEFRTSQNWIGGTMPSNAVFVPPPIHTLHDLLSDFDKFVNNDDLFIPELIKVAIAHYQFETIHPFLDGNGRIGRILIPLYLLAKKELFKPCFYISDYFEKNRTEYYERLNNVRTKNDMLGWIKFFLTASIQTAQQAKNKFIRVIDLINNYNVYLRAYGKNSNNLGKIIDNMYIDPVTSIADLSKTTKLSIPTIQKYLDILIKDEKVVEITGNYRNRMFCLIEYFGIFVK